MKFSEIVEHASALLQRKGRITYGALKREFDLDDDALADLKDELIEGEQIARDGNGRVLIWTGGEGARTEAPASTIPTSPGSLTPPSTQAEAAAPEHPAPEGERRQLTVMFCDLVGSTALSEQLDPEDLQTVVRTYQEVSAQVIERYEGYIAQYLGDGLLVYFGYPTAHEDDASRSIHAGLEILTALHQARSRFPQPVQVRIGIHTGPVVVGQMGGGSRREQLALGETPNLAARVQGKAAPDTVVISSATYRLVDGLFNCQDLGPQDLKGISSAQSLYQVRSESDVQSRFEVSVRAGLTPLVGRTEELGLLGARWEQATAGEGQAVLLSGEAGIGKSRLIQELKDRVIREGATRMEFRCSPYHQNSALYPVIEQLHRVLQFARDDAPAVKLEKLAQTLSRYQFPQADTLLLFAALLSLPPPEGVPPLTLSPQKQKEQTLEALVGWLFEEAEGQAVYCAWEDLHWADPSTLELLTLYLDQVPTARMLALVTFRPEFVPPWSSRSYLSQLTLGRLEHSQVVDVVAHVTDGRAFPDDVVEQVVAKTDGVPLFVEELTKMIIESGLVRAVNSHYELTGPLSSFAIPATLHDSLMARLDRLGEAKEVAQLGTAIGREFSYELVQAITPLDDAPLQYGLKRLVASELVYQRGLIPAAHYQFKHALIQDTAYESLLKTTRRQYHRQIAQVLEDRFPETVETQPELVAHHYTEAGLPEQALSYWQRAGERASQRSAYVEAISHLTRELKVLKTLPDTPEHAQQELLLQTSLGEALMATKGNSALEVERAFARALELCRRVGETPQLFLVMFGLYLFYHGRHASQTCRELTDQMLRLAQNLQDPGLLLTAHATLGVNMYWRGEFTSARTRLEQALALYDPQQPPPVFHSADHRLDCLSYASWTLCHLGYPDQGLKRIQEALALAEGLSHLYSLTMVLGNAAVFHLLRRDGQLALELAEETIALATEQEFPLFLATATAVRGWAVADQGQLQEGIDMFRTRSAVFLGLLAEVFSKVGQVEEGLTVVAEALAIVDKSGQRVYEAELHRVKGELTLQSKVQSQKPKVEEEAEAEECFQKALDIARQQEAKSWELRAATSLARLWQRQGKIAEAHDLLASVYDWFTEGFDTQDLKDAKALLEALA